MRSLKSPRIDPAPSRLGYRYQRLMLTPAFRKMVKVGLPVLIVGGLIAGWVARDANRQMIADAYIDIKTQIQQRDEFMVKAMAVDGADETLDADVRMVLPVEFPVSSFDLDLEEMRQTVAALPAVADATVRGSSGRNVAGHCDTT